MNVNSSLTFERLAKAVRLMLAGVGALPILLTLQSCAEHEPSSRELDRQLMVVTTSPIPGARATVLQSTATSPGEGKTVGFCVTDAGYCRLAAATAAGRNCLCETTTAAYGGTTAAAPQTYKDQ